MVRFVVLFSLSHQLWLLYLVSSRSSVQNGFKRQNQKSCTTYMYTQCLECPPLSVPNVGAFELLHRGRSHDIVPPRAPHVHAGLSAERGPCVHDGQAAEHLQLPRAADHAPVSGGLMYFFCFHPRHCLCASAIVCRFWVGKMMLFNVLVGCMRSFKQWRFICKIYAFLLKIRTGMNEIHNLYELVWRRLDSVAVVRTSIGLATNCC